MDSVSTSGDGEFPYSFDDNLNYSLSDNSDFRRESTAEPAFYGKFAD